MPLMPSSALQFARKRPVTGVDIQKGSEMNMEDMILISVDDHVIEPPHAFRNHMPKSLSSRAPYVEHRPEGDRWVVDGRTVLMAGLNAVVGRPRSEYGIEPMSFGQVRAGSYDINARIDDMNANGVLGSMCFPTLLGFGGGLASSFEDKEYALSLVRAYNDWHVHEWVGGAPGRLIPLGLLPLWDMPGTVAEVKRLSALGVHAVCFPDNPRMTGCRRSTVNIGIPFGRPAPITR